MQAEAVFFDFRVTRRRVVVLTAGVAALIALALLYRTIDVAALHQRAEGVNGVLVFALLTVLPLAGFPASVAHAVAGMRFGFGPGLALVSISLVLQLLASYALVKAKPKLFARHLKPLTERLPEGAHASVTQFTMLLPGVPFFAQIYALPLVGVPLGILLRWSLPIQIAKSAIGVVFGDMSDDLTPFRLVGFATYTVFVIVACAWAFRRLRERMQAAPAKKAARRRRRG